ncbi:MAG: type II toxin-antitoxin system PemK/MazF family toxin [Pseudomonadota bacterium]
MKRGDLVTVSLPGDFGKPRPALIIQANLFLDHPSVVVVPITGEVLDAPLFRISVTPTVSNGLHKLSQVMLDKPYTVTRAKVGEPFGYLDERTLLEVNRALAVFLGIA